MSTNQTDADLKREKHNARLRAYRAAHPEAVREMNRRYREKNLERLRAYDEARRESRRPEHRAYDAAHREERREKARLRRATNEAKLIYREWRAMGCAVCGASDWTKVHAHHIDPLDKTDNPSAILDAETMRCELTRCIRLCASHHALAHAAIRYGKCARDADSLMAYLKEQV